MTTPDPCNLCSPDQLGVDEASDGSVCNHVRRRGESKLESATGTPRADVHRPNTIHRERRPESGMSAMRGIARLRCAGVPRGKCDRRGETRTDLCRHAKAQDARVAPGREKRRHLEETSGEESKSTPVSPSSATRADVNPTVAESSPCRTPTKARERYFKRRSDLAGLTTRSGIPA